MVVHGDPRSAQVYPRRGILEDGVIVPAVRRGRALVEVESHLGAALVILESSGNAIGIRHIADRKAELA